MRTYRPLLAALLLAALFPLAQYHPSEAAAPPSILPNGDVEYEFYAPENSPTGWKRDQFQPTALLYWDEEHALHHRRSIAIHAPTPNDARWITTVNVEPNTLYLLSGWIKTENVAHSGQSVDLGANLSLLEDWIHTPGIVGTQDWTYVSVLFDSGQRTSVTVAARLGFWSGITTGRAWFDALRLTRVPITEATPVPAWNILMLIYQATDFTFIDDNGVKRHVVARMSDEEREGAAREATAFVTGDIPALTSGMQRPKLTIRYPNAPLSRLSRAGPGWSPAPGDIGADRDLAFDSTIVIWDPRVTEQRTGERLWIGAAAGLASPMGLGPTYVAQIIESTQYGHRNVFKHEWGHSILFYSAAAGIVPHPLVSNHTDEGTYVHCPTGTAYVWVDEFEANPIPNSIYNNQSGFTHDYYSGTIATADNPTRCLGLNRRAWALGGPLSRPNFDYPYYHQFAVSPPELARRAAPGSVSTYTLTLTNTGNLTDSFSVAISQAGWETRAPAALGPLAPRQAAQLTVQVLVPPAALAEQFDRAQVLLTSANDPAESHLIDLTTTVAQRFGLALTPALAEQTAEPGQTARYTLTLTNTGNLNDSVSLRLSGNSWRAEAPAELPELPPGAGVDFDVHVAVPTDAIGASDTLTVHASSRGGGGVWTAILRTHTPAAAPRWLISLPLLRQ